MKQYITGLGMTTTNIDSLSSLNHKNIDAYDLLKPADKTEDYLDYRVAFKSARLLAREDRSLLNDCAKLMLDSSIEAMNQAISNSEFTDSEKENCAIYCASEMASYDLIGIGKLLESKQCDEKEVLATLGELKSLMHPLDMLRNLSTNPLYHLSKMFGFRGGGYPVRRMSLSGLHALELAVNDLCSTKALVSAAGSMANIENLCTFMKMNLVRTTENNTGILPAIGSASLMIEALRDDEIKTKAPVAEILAVKTIFKSESLVKLDDWMRLYAYLADTIEPQNLAVVRYNNGVQALSEIEEDAVALKFPFAKTYSYKFYIGYTGKANNLIDLTIALSDKRIPIGQQILVNGIGTNMGLGFILVRKLRHA